jgi:hypothetical protein
VTAPKPARMGRPPVPADQQARVPYNIRLTPAQRTKVEQLGGAAWIRAQIEKAKGAKSE